MNLNRILGIHAEGKRRRRASADRVVAWTLVFMNGFFLTYFFAKLFRFIRLG